MKHPSNQLHDLTLTCWQTGALSCQLEVRSIRILGKWKRKELSFCGRSEYQFKQHSAHLSSHHWYVNWNKEGICDWVKILEGRASTMCINSSVMKFTILNRITTFIKLIAQLVHYTYHKKIDVVIVKEMSGCGEYTGAQGVHHVLRHYLFVIFAVLCQPLDKSLGFTSNSQSDFLLYEPVWFRRGVVPLFDHVFIQHIVVI